MSDEFAIGVEEELKEHGAAIRAFFPKADEETIRKFAAAVAEAHIKKDPKYYSKVEKIIKD